MDAAATAVLAFSMSMDAFAAAIGKGAALRRPHLTEALRTGLIFGVVEAITPIIGWAVGVAAVAWIAQIDHWVAFALLGVLGVHMACKALSSTDREPAPRHSLSKLVLTAFATSLDAMAVGISLAVIQVDIAAAATAIGLATFLMATIGTLTGHWLGPALGRGAEFAGGLCLVAIGLKILLDHTLGA